MILSILAYLCFGLAVLAWLVAAISALEMMRHIEPGRGFWWFATNGHAFFSGKGFTPDAAPYRRRFGIAAGCFIMFIMLGLVTSAIFTQLPGS